MTVDILCYLNDFRKYRQKFSIIILCKHFFCNFSSLQNPFWLIYRNYISNNCTFQNWFGQAMWIVGDMGCFVILGWLSKWGNLLACTTILYFFFWSNIIFIYSGFLVQIMHKLSWRDSWTCFCVHDMNHIYIPWNWNVHSDILRTVSGFPMRHQATMSLTVYHPQGKFGKFVFLSSS